MGLDTKGVIKQEITVIDIKRSIEELFDVEVSVQSHFNDEMFVFDFSFLNNETNKTEGRNLNLFFNNTDYANEVGSYHALISLHYWGASVNIIENLVKKFGGYLLKIDNTDDWEYIEALSPPLTQTLDSLLEQRIYKDLNFKKEVPIQERLALVQLIIENKSILKSILNNTH